jgi:glycosyltransferase involved in cell wall biosynthesis
MLPHQAIQVMYLSYDGMTDPLGQSQVLPYLCGLTKKGYRFRLLSFEKPERFAKYRETIQSICDENQITWIPLMYTKRPPLLSTLYDMWRMRRLVVALHKKEAIAMIHCRSYLTALIGRKMKKKEGIPFLFDMRGFWADERVEGGIWSLKNPVFRLVYRYFKKRETVLLQDANHVISLTHRAKDEIEKWPCWSNTKPNITVIPCCVDVDRFNSERISGEQKNRLLTDLGIQPSTFVLGYVGSIGTWYMLPEMFRYFQELQHHMTSAVFLFVTQHEKQEILTVANSCGVDEKSIRIASCSHDEVPFYMSVMNRSLFFIRPSYSKMASSPTKQGEIMAMGIPLICNAGVGDTDRIVLQYQAGTVLSDVSDEQIMQSFHQPLLFDCLKCIEGAKDYFSLQNGVERYHEVYQQILQT